MSQLRYWVWLSSRQNVRRETIVRLLEDYPSPQQIFFAPDEELAQKEYIRPSEIRALSDRSMQRTREILRLCEENHWQILTMQDAAYPERLRNISDPPPVLYVRGKLPAMDEEAAVAVVGTRSCSPYGAASAAQIAYDMAKTGAVVITGLARGVDASAAQSALLAGGQVVGVAPCSLDLVYPPEHRKLYEDVAASGAVVTELPPTTPVTRQVFSMRNRLLSGLALGVVVVEAPQRSGALITASCAAQQGRDVFVVPGCIDSPGFAGSHQLIRDGAILITSGTEVTEEYRDAFPDKLKSPSETAGTGWQKTLEKLPNMGENKDVPAKKVVDKSGDEAYIDLVTKELSLQGDEAAALRALSSEPRHVDDVAAEAGLSAAQALAALTMLEIEGAVQQRPGKLFVLNHP